MALDRAIYKAFEQVVGKRNISEDPGVLETYRCIAAQSSAHYGPYDHKTPTPQAVVMPGSTKEVQGCIRLCNKYGIHFKASTTFWSAHGYIDDDYSIQFDMHRMKNFSIDAKNMTMTVEPYVIAGTAQAEAMRYGLTCNIPGVGCSSSVLALRLHRLRCREPSLLRVGAAERRYNPYRLRGRRPCRLHRRGPRSRFACPSPQRRRPARRVWHLHAHNLQALPVARPVRTDHRRPRSGVFREAAEEHPCLYPLLPRLG